KLYKEPLHCLKCQKMGMGHFASSYPQKEECCGTCGVEHRMQTCPVLDREGRFCINCILSGHAAWDRRCPIFTSHFDKLTVREPLCPSLYKSPQTCSGCIYVSICIIVHIMN
ncbi:hypothetical protein M422DRAFT_176655, partial [Sphaerobolus stellatus SS14]